MSPLLLFLTLLLGACAAYAPWRSRSANHVAAILTAVLTMVVAMNIGFPPLLTNTS